MIDNQVGEIEALGVEFRYKTPLKPGFGLEEIMRLGYHAVFVAVGASHGRRMQLEGGEADGVINAIEYLFNINRGCRLAIGRRAAIVGGGLVAITLPVPPYAPWCRDWLSRPGRKRRWRPARCVSRWTRRARRPGGEPWK